MTCRRFVDALHKEHALPVDGFEKNSGEML